MIRALLFLALIIPTAAFAQCQTMACVNQELSKINATERYSRFGGYAALGLLSSVALNEYNGPEHKVRTFVESVVLSYGVALIETQKTKHEGDPTDRNTKLWNSAYGFMGGAASYGILTYKWNF